ncbi:MAG: hypothetical protein V4724_16370 [Pseudomonadota bacterium]
MKPVFLSALAAGLLTAASAASAEDSIATLLRAQLETRDAVWGGGTRSYEQAEWRWQAGLPLQNALRGVFTARHASDENSRLHVNELSLERPLGAGFLSAGKKVVSWDVGYAFRPLDVVQQEDRRALNPATLEGVPMLEWEMFDASRAVTVVLSNPGRGRADQPRGDGSLALRLYRQQGTRDEYAVLRLSERNGIEGGVSFSHVVNEGLEVHGSVLFQQRHEQWMAPRALAPYWRRFDGGGKALAGINWTGESKFSVLGEAWLDRTAPDSQQGNVLLRAAQNMDELDVSADVLWQPQNGSRIASVGVSWKPGPWLVSLSWRHYGGSAGTVLHSTGIATLQYAY